MTAAVRKSTSKASRKSLRKVARKPASKGAAAAVQPAPPPAPPAPPAAKQSAPAPAAPAQLVPLPKGVVVGALPPKFVQAQRSTDDRMKEISASAAKLTSLASKARYALDQLSDCLKAAEIHNVASTAVQAFRDELANLNQAIEGSV